MSANPRVRVLVALAVLASATAALVLAPAARADEPLLVQAWQGVVAHSPEYAAALARRQAGGAAADAARALWLPTIAAQGGLARRNAETVTSGAQFSAPGFGTSNGVDFRTSIDGGSARQWAFVAQQPIVDAARAADAAALRARGRMADAQFRQTEQALMVRTAEALAALVRTGAQLDAVRREHASSLKARDAAEARFESGDLPVTEWREAQAQADQFEVAELDASQAAAVAVDAWTHLTGLPAGAAYAGAGSAEGVTAGNASGAGGVLEDWLQRARASSPALDMQRAQVVLADAEARRWSRLEGFQLSLVGQLGRETLSGSGDFGEAGATQRMASVGLQATLPLFTGGLRAAQRRGADAALRASQSDLDAADQQVELQARAAWLAAGTARARLAATRRAAESAALRLDATRIGREAGERTLLDLLSAEGAALQAAALAAGARCDALVAELRLAAVAGTIDPQALRAAAGGEYSCGQPAGP